MVIMWEKTIELSFLGERQSNLLFLDFEVYLIVQ